MTPGPQPLLGDRQPGIQQSLRLAHELAEVKGFREHSNADGRLEFAGSHGDGGKSGDEDDPQIRSFQAGAPGQFDAVQAWHDDVRDQQIRARVVQFRVGLQAVGGDGHAMARLFEAALEKSAQDLIVLGKHDTRHPAPLWPLLAIPRADEPGINDTQTAASAGLRTTKDRTAAPSGDHDSAPQIPYNGKNSNETAMDAVVQPRPTARAPSPATYDILAPAALLAPVVLASPHSGSEYQPDFLAASRLDIAALRRSEDCYIDELYAAAPQLGLPLIRARFPRTFIDPNREPYEFDSEMFVEALPGFVNCASPRVTAGLGTIPRVVTNGEEIYPTKLRLADALERVKLYYRPYHEALSKLIAHSQERFGLVLLLDCHSMPSVGGPMDRDAGSRRVDFVLGDCHGASCGAKFVEAAETHLAARGYHVTRNIPYAGGFTTRHYGRPGERRHALQIEINRALYMNEENFERRPHFAALAADLRGLMMRLADIARDTARR